MTDCVVVWAGVVGEVVDMGDSLRKNQRAKEPKGPKRNDDGGKGEQAGGGEEEVKNDNGFRSIRKPRGLRVLAGF